MAVLTADKTYKLNGVTVKDFLLTTHNPNKISMPQQRTKKLLGVTVHNTNDLENVNDDAEQYTRATYNGNMRNVRVHYYVDDLGAWHNLPDNWQSWHAGQNGKADKNGSEAGNAQTISIECIMTGETDSKAEDNCARLAAYLLHSNGLTIDNLYTHNYWCNIRNGKTGTVDYLNKTNDGYKNCPIYIRPHWDKFKATVQGYMQQLAGNTQATSPEVATDTSFRVRILDDALNIRQMAGTKSQIVGVITDHGVYTIVETTYVGVTQWGRLKSGAGWISLNRKYVAKL